MATQTRIHLRPLKAINLPQHPDLVSKQSSWTDLQRFVSEVLDEGQRFMTKTLEEEFKTKGTRNDAPATAPIKIRSLVLKPPNMPEENWFARTSEHENTADAGTATWDEFDGNLRVNHSDNEKTYTPSVQAARLEYSWKEQLAAFDAQVGQWQEVAMEIRAMQHKIPNPLKDRLFRVLVITAAQHKSFIVVQIPVSVDDIPEKDKPTPAPKVVNGVYCSVETGKLSDDGQQTTW